MAFCHKCGYKLDPGDKFCFECGTPVRRAVSEKSDESKHDTEKENIITEDNTSSFINYADQNDISETEESEESVSSPKYIRNNRKLLVIAVAAISVLLCVGLVTVLAVKNNSSKNNSAHNNIRVNVSNTIVDSKGSRDTKDSSVTKETSVTQSDETSLEQTDNRPLKKALGKKYSVDTNGKETFIVEFEYQYDSAGNRIKHIIYDEKGNKDVWYEYEYDKAGRQTKVVMYSAQVKDNYTISIFKYDSRGNKIYESSGNKDGTFIYITYEYDDQNNLILVKKNYQGKVSEKKYSGAKSSFEYDVKGNVIHKVDPDGYTEEFYEYDKNGNKTQYKITKQGVIQKLYKYDKYGNELSEMHFNEDGNKELEYKYVYEYIYS